MRRPADTLIPARFLLTTSHLLASIMVYSTRVSSNTHLIALLETAVKAYFTRTNCRARTSSPPSLSLTPPPQSSTKLRRRHWWLPWDSHGPVLWFSLLDWLEGSQRLTGKPAHFVNTPVHFPSHSIYWRSVKPDIASNFIATVALSYFITEAWHYVAYWYIFAFLTYVFLPCVWWFVKWGCWWGWCVKGRADAFGDCACCTRSGV